MAFQNGIKDSWGGRPYIDLVKGFEYIEKNLSYVDTSRAVALGASVRRLSLSTWHIFKEPGSEDIARQYETRGFVSKARLLHNHCPM